MGAGAPPGPAGGTCESLGGRAAQLRRRGRAATASGAAGQMHRGPRAGAPPAAEPPSRTTSPSSLRKTRAPLTRPRRSLGDPGRSEGLERDVAASPRAQRRGDAAGCRGCAAPSASAHPNKAPPPAAAACARAVRERCRPLLLKT